MRLFGLEEKHVQNSCNNIVKSVRPGGDSESSNCKKHRKIDARHSPKTKFRPVEIGDAAELAVEENYVMMRAE